MAFSSFNFIGLVMSIIHAHLKAFLPHVWVEIRREDGTGDSDAEKCLWIS
jgi:hypothetical protein